LGVVPLGVALGQEPLVAPPQVDPAPVDGVPGGSGGERGQQAVAVAPAGQHDRGGAAGGLGVHDLGDQPGRRGLGHQLLVAVYDELWGAHFAAFFAGCFPPVLPVCSAAGSCAAAGAGFATSAGAAVSSAALPSAASVAAAAGSAPAPSRSTPYRSAEA